MKRSSLVVVVVAALVVIGIVIYLARPRPEEFDAARTASPASAPQPAANAIASPSGASGLPSTVAACLGPVSTPQSPITALDARHEWARSLAAKSHYDTALPEFRNIAATDPGYPGINLEISEALRKTKHAPEANDAINVQLELSECLAKLTPSDADAYCKTQWATVPAAGCSAELAKIDSAARSEAKLVKVELARSPAPAAPAVLARATPPPAPRPTPAPPPAKSVAAAAPPEPVAEKPAPPKPPVLLKAADASSHIGDRATVCGLVVSKNTSQTTGKPTFFNLDKPFPNQTFTVVVWDADTAQTGELPGSGDLCVTGTITLYRGTPEIVVRDAKNWSRSTPD